MFRDTNSIQSISKTSLIDGIKEADSTSKSTNSTGMFDDFLMMSLTQGLGDIWSDKCEQCDDVSCEDKAMLTSMVETKR